jgi:hypothetical protein
VSSLFRNPGTVHLENQEPSQINFIDPDAYASDGSNMTNPLHGRPGGKSITQKVESRKFSGFQAARRVFQNS